MKINIFKHDGAQLFNDLKNYNYLIQKAYDTYEPPCVSTINCRECKKHCK